MTKPLERIHSEPGRFWIISDGMDFDPLASMQGILTIKDDGQSELELLPQIWSWVISLDEVISGRHIEIGGQLHRIDQNVRMTRVWLQSYSPVKLSSLVSLMVPGDLVLLKHSQSIKMLTIPLENTWPWLGIPMPVGERIDQHYTIRYPLPEYKSFKISNADVHLTSSYNVNYDMQMRAANVKPYAEIEFDFDTPITITSAQGICLDFEDLLVLLTNQECGLEWPKASIPDSDASGSLYFSRRRKVGGTVSHLYCWVPYPEIEHAFGSILDEWFKKRTEHGAAFHLYLGTRRGDQLYAEHRFINLIWGLEALNRKCWPMRPENPKRKVKVKSILKALDGIANAKDKATIRKAFEREPSLEDRLKEMFTSLPVAISKEAFKEFAKQCAARRNDISHHGGPRDSASYEGFPLKLHELSSALAPLYHLLILASINVPSEVIQGIFLKSHKSFRELAYLKRVGLEIVDEL
jgi:hypothetical protein